jgi:riboflavin kinase/FMN adenylyltransferase
MKSVVTIGTFDGIHLGHQALLNRANEWAGKLNLQSIAYTFPKPPQNYLGVAKDLLLPASKKIELLREYVDLVEIADFLHLQPLSPEEFVQDILLSKLKIAAIVVGEDFKFGKDRVGNVEVLQQLGNSLGYEVDLISPIFLDDEQVSSTLTRRALREGEFEKAKRFLGKSPRLWGEVVKGHGEASQLGWPTANLHMDPDVLTPAHGVYVAHVKLDGKLNNAALYIGDRPTLGGKGTSIEVHILNLSSLELHGLELEVQILARLRGDQKFDSFQELKEQIAQDIEACNDYFEKPEAS